MNSSDTKTQAIAAAIREQLKKEPSILLANGDSRIKFFKERAIDIRQGEKIWQALRPVVEAQLLPLYKSLFEKNAIITPGKPARIHVQTTPPLSSVVLGNAQDHSMAKDYLSPSTPISLQDDDIRAAEAFSIYNNMPVPPGYSKKVKAVCTMATALFPNNLQAQAESWRVRDVGVLGIVDKVYETFKIHESEIKARTADIRESNKTIKTLKDELSIADLLTKNQEAQIRSITANHTDLGSQLAAAQEKLDFANLKAQEHAQSIQDVVHQLSASQSEVQELLTSRQQVEHDKTALAADVNAIHAQLLDANLSVQTGNVRITFLETALEQVQEELSQARSDLLIRSSENETLTQQLCAVQQDSTFIDEALLGQLRRDVRQELRNDDAFCAEVVGLEQAKATAQATRLVGERQAQRASAAAKGRHTRACKNEQCIRAGCVKKRQLRLPHCRRVLRSDRAVDVQQITQAALIHLPDELVCTLDGRYYTG